MTRRLFLVVLGLLVVAACGGSQTQESIDTAREGSTPAPARTQTIRMEIPIAPDLPDIPRLMARERLQAMGYAVEATAYSDNVIAIQAMVEGKLDFARVPMPQALVAIQKGTPISVILGGGDQRRILAVTRDIKTCADLNHKQVSIPNLISAQTLTLRRFIATRCPGTQVELVVIAGVDNRVMALVANRTSAAILEFASMFDLLRVHGSKFNVLSDFSVDFPGLNGAVVVAPRAFIAKHPATVRDIVRALLVSARQVNEPADLKSALEKYLGLESQDAENTITSYRQQRPWNINGGLSDEILQSNIDFFVEAGLLKPGLTPAIVSEPSHLNALLDELGRR